MVLRYNFFAHWSSKEEPYFNYGGKETKYAEDYAYGEGWQGEVGH